jgi:hypothetical protein
MSRSAPLIIRLARFFAGEAAPKARVRVLLRAIQNSAPCFFCSSPSLLCHSERSEESRIPFLQGDLRLTLGSLSLAQPGRKCRTDLFRHLRITVILKGPRPVESRIFFLA